MLNKKLNKMLDKLIGPRTYHYYVSFKHSMGHGMSDVTLNHEIDSFDDVVDIAKSIQNAGKGFNVMVIGYQLLRID